MNIVKVSCPIEWNINLPGLKTQFHRMTPGLTGKWADYTFLINDSTTACDYWLVYGFLENTETVVVKRKTVLLLSEEKGIKIWNNDFMEQFDVVIGSQTEVQHSNYIHDQYVCGWQVKKSYDQLMAILPPIKNKTLSIIASNTRSTAGHKKRHDFVKNLNAHFGHRVDWFGKGNNFINDKWDGLYNYKFSVAIENQRADDYFTEKIADCFLSYTIPFYYGCSNIDKYFPAGSYVNIDLDNLNKSIDKIEEMISGDYYHDNFEALKEARELILNRYQMMPKLKEWLDLNSTTVSASKEVTLYPETIYIKPGLKNKIKRGINIIFNNNFFRIRCLTCK